jgi:hypothetical protein
LPREGDRFVDPVVGFEVEILKVEGHRIGRVRLTTRFPVPIDRGETDSPGEDHTNRVRDGEPYADAPEIDQPTESFVPNAPAEVDRS